MKRGKVGVKRQTCSEEQMGGGGRHFLKTRSIRKEEKVSR